MKSAMLLVMLLLLLNCRVTAQEFEIDFYARSEHTDSLSNVIPTKFLDVPNRRITYKNNLLSFETGKGTEKVKILRVFKFVEGTSKIYALEAEGGKGMYKYYRFIVTRVSLDADIYYFIIPNVVNGLYVSETTYMN